MARPSIFQTILNRDEAQETQMGSVNDIPPFRNTYQEKLRLIGMHLDRQSMRRMTLIEVPGGVLVRAVGGDGITEELLEFPDDSFESHYDEAVRQRNQVESDDLRIKSELIPTSYSDVMRAIGAWLDEGLARSVVVSEGAGGIYVTGMMLQETSMQSRYAPFDEFFSPDGIDLLLTEAHQRRGTYS